MKKSLAIIGLLMAFSQPSFAQCGSCNPCNPCLTGAACPVQTCAPACNPCAPRISIVPIIKTCTQACAPVCDPCNPCATGAAVPVTVSSYAVDPDYNEYCCKKGFWRNFFSF
ncbi:MAG: hypothetical protein A2104_06615 [Candidatus Melainabacteria bacterium GWF2_32_7]|nr:MAG: hypothetical protein A2104_06615 [Candidatus Melainabacteria bacterium GWF2_32_7]